MQAVYIKADRDVEVDRTDIRIGDVIQIEGTDKRTREQICRLPLVTVSCTDQKKESRMCLSILQVIRKIHTAFPQLDIVNVGEKDFIITYKKEKDAGKIPFTCSKPP